MEGGEGKGERSLAWGLWAAALGAQPGVRPKKGQVAADRLWRWGLAGGRVSPGVTEWEMGPSGDLSWAAGHEPERSSTPGWPGSWVQEAGDAMPRRAGALAGSTGITGVGWGPGQVTKLLGRILPGHSGDSGAPPPVLHNGMRLDQSPAEAGTVKNQGLTGKML